MSPRTWEALLTVLKESACTITGGRDPRVTTLRQDASNRSYHRVEVTGGHPRSLVVMQLQDARPEEATKGPLPVELPFLDVQRYLAAGGIPVPQVFLHDAAAGLIYLEDLGDLTMESVVSRADPPTRLPYYRLAIACLGDIQAHAHTRTYGCVAFERRFDGDLLRWELDHFREWLLEAQRGIVLGGLERQALDRAFDKIVRVLVEVPTVFVHRDYQSRNIMILHDNMTGSRLKVIDFQDALIGPLPYDLVGLLRDSYVELTPPEVDALIDQYWLDHGVRRAPSLSRAEFRRLFDMQTVQRKLKDAGRFVFIERKKNNPSFLPFVSPSLRYVARALESLPELAELRELLAARLPEFDPPPSPTDRAPR